MSGRGGSPRPGPDPAVSADAILLGTILVWSFNFTAIRYGISHDVLPLTYVALRWILAAAALAFVTWRLEGGLRVPRRDLVALIALAVVGQWANQTAYAYANHLISATTIALVFGTLPLFVSVLSQLAGVERLRRRHWVAVVISLGGVVLVALGNRGSVSASVWGVLLVLASVSTWAIYSVGSVRLMRRHSALRVNAITALAGALLLNLTAIPQLGRQDWALGGWSWAAVVYSGLASIALGNVLWLKAVGRVGPGRAALYVNLQPFLGTVFAVLVLHEHLSWLQIAGGLVVAAAIVVGRTGRAPAAAPVE